MVTKVIIRQGSERSESATKFSSIDNLATAETTGGFTAPIDTDSDAGIVNFGASVIEMSGTGQFEIRVDRWDGNDGALKIPISLEAGNLNNTNYDQLDVFVEFSAGEMGSKVVTGQLNSTGIGASYFWVTIGDIVDVDSKGVRALQPQRCLVLVDNGGIDTNAIICDNDSGNDTTGEGTLANPYKTIQKAHDIAVSSETRHVYIRKSVADYKDFSFSGSDFSAGCNVNNVGGDYEKMLIIEPYPGDDMPILNFDRFEDYSSAVDTWLDYSHVGTQTSSTTFTVPGDLVDGYYHVDRDIRFNGSITTIITNSVHNAGTTTVTVQDAVVPGTITSIELGNGYPICGFYMNGIGCIIIKGLEILRASGSGIMGNFSNNSNDVYAIRNDIHNIYGRENIGGFRFDKMINGISYRNKIYKIYSTRTTATSNPFDSEPHGLHSGIHGFDQVDCVAENNELYNLSKGVFVKDANGSDKPSTLSRRNEIYDISEQSITWQVGGAGGSDVFDAVAYQNLIHDVNEAFTADLVSSIDQSRRLSVFNNTILNQRVGFFTQGMKNLKTYNNIYEGNSTLFGTNYKLIDANYTANQTYEFDCVDNNIFYNLTLQWVIFVGATPTKKTYTSLATWQAAVTTDNAVGFSVDPDQNSSTTDPQLDVNNDPQAAYVLTHGKYNDKVGAIQGHLTADDIGAGW